MDERILSPSCSVNWARSLPSSLGLRSQRSSLFSPSAVWSITSNERTCIATIYDVSVLVSSSNSGLQICRLGTSRGQINLCRHGSYGQAGHPDRFNSERCGGQKRGVPPHCEFHPHRRCLTRLVLTDPGNCAVISRHSHTQTTHGEGRRCRMVLPFSIDGG